MKQKRGGDKEGCRGGRRRTRSGDGGSGVTGENRGWDASADCDRAGALRIDRQRTGPLCALPEPARAPPRQDARKQTAPSQNIETEFSASPFFCAACFLRRPRHVSCAICQQMSDQ